MSLELLGDALLLGDVVLDASGDVLLLGDVVLDAAGAVVVLGVVVVLPPEVLGPLLGVGGVRLTSPPEEFVTVPLGAAALLGMQSVVIAELDVVPLVDADMPLDDVLEADARAAAESAAVTGGVAPVPFAPFVLFRPVKR